jgi:phosphonatase-like hydrolase
MLPPELVVFDLAGTTVQDPGGVSGCLIAALQEAGVNAARTDANDVMGLPKPEALRQILLRHGRHDLFAQIDALHASFVRRMLTYYRDDPHVAEIPGTSRTFEALRQAGIKVAVNTGFSRDITNLLLDRLPWVRQGLLDDSIASDEVPRGRPHPDMIRALSKRFGIGSPAKIAKVGDTPSDLQEGTNAGCGWVIGVTEGTHTRAQLFAYPHTHLIATVAQLPALLFGSN